MLREFIELVIASPEACHTHPKQLRRTGFGPPLGGSLMTDVAHFNTLAAAALKKAEDFRTKAQECDQRADRTSDVWVKQQFEDCAQHWRRLAEEAECRA